MAPYNEVSDIALQADGKIVVSGCSWSFTIVRYNANGSLDSSFGPAHSGVMTLTDDFTDHPGVWSDPNAVAVANSTGGLAIQPDGKIVAVGGLNYNPGWLVARFDTAGNPDPAFGIRGTTFFSLPTQTNQWAGDVALQADGKIVVLGMTDSWSSFYVGRFDTSGAPDGTFGSGGIVETRIGVNCYARSLAIQPDGQIVAAGGMTSDGTNTDWALVRYLGSSTVTASSLSTSAAVPSTSKSTQSNTTGLGVPTSPAASAASHFAQKSPPWRARQAVSGPGRSSGGAVIAPSRRTFAVRIATVRPSGRIAGNVHP